MFEWVGMWLVGYLNIKWEIKLCQCLFPSSYCERYLKYSCEIKCLKKEDNLIN